MASDGLKAYRSEGRSKRRLFVGNLARGVTHSDLGDLFHKFGRIINTKIVRGYNKGTTFGFLEFAHDRDAREAVMRRDGYSFLGARIRVEFSYNRNDSGNEDHHRHSERDYSNNRRPYRVIVSGLPKAASWQDLKDHMRGFGVVGHVEARRGDGYGTLEFWHHDEMKRAIRKMDNTKFRCPTAESTYITVVEDIEPRLSRSRSRSRSRRRSRSASKGKKSSPPPQHEERNRKRSTSPIGERYWD